MARETKENTEAANADAKRPVQRLVSNLWRSITWLLYGRAVFANYVKRNVKTKAQADRFWTNLEYVYGVDWVLQDMNQILAKRKIGLPDC